MNLKMWLSGKWTKNNSELTWKFLPEESQNPVLKKKTKVKTDKKKSLLIEMLYYFLKSWTGDSALVFLYQ